MPVRTPEEIAEAQRASSLKSWANSIAKTNESIATNQEVVNGLKTVDTTEMSEEAQAIFVKEIDSYQNKIDEAPAKVAGFQALIDDLND